MPNRASCSTRHSQDTVLASSFFSAETTAEGQTIIPATLAQWLSVTRPAVTFALKRLTKDGLVSVTSDGHVRLTSQGQEIAERTIVRHHLTAFQARVEF